jgi:hypothetical protein
VRRPFGRASRDLVRASSTRERSGESFTANAARFFDPGGKVLIWAPSGGCQAVTVERL